MVLMILPNFNSIKVQLKHTGSLDTNGNKIDFNSIKVQLKLNNLGTNLSNLQEFQFHKGTIKTAT